MCPQGKQNPPLRKQHCTVGFRLIFGRSWSRRERRNTVVAAQCLVARVDFRLQAVSLGHGSLEIVRNQEARDATEMLKHADVRANSG